LKFHCLKKRKKKKKKKRRRGVNPWTKTPDKSTISPRHWGLCSRSKRFISDDFERASERQISQQAKNVRTSKVIFKLIRTSKFESQKDQNVKSDLPMAFGLLNLT
jgi:hypothetical protein